MRDYDEMKGRDGEMSGVFLLHKSVIMNQRTEMFVSASWAVVSH